MTKELWAKVDQKQFPPTMFHHRLCPSLPCFPQFEKFHFSARIHESVFLSPISGLYSLKSSMDQMRILPQNAKLPGLKPNPRPSEQPSGIKLLHA